MGEGWGSLDPSRHDEVSTKRFWEMKSEITQSCPTLGKKKKKKKKNLAKNKP